jgi:Ca2+-binding EF-hand superfamily protein
MPPSGAACRKDDLCKLVFSVYDPDNYGVITQTQLLDMLTMLHPANQGPVTVRVMMMMMMMVMMVMMMMMW